MEKEIKEPKSQKEINNLIEERHALEEGLKKFIKKVANHTESGEKHLSLLCMSTKPIHDVRKLIMFLYHSIPFIFKALVFHYI